MIKDRINKESSWFNLRMKLYLSFISVILLFLIALGISMTMNNKISTLTNDIFDVNKKMDVVGNVNTFAKNANGNAAQFLLAPENLQASFKERYLSDVEMVNTQIEQLQSMTKNKSEIGEIENFNEEWKAFTSNAEMLFGLFENGEVLRAQESYTRKSFDPVAFALLSYNYDQEKIASEKEMEISEAISTVRYVNIIVPIIVIIISLILSSILANRITRNIKLVQDNALQVANGNLVVDEIKIKSKDELGVLAESFNTMVTSLKGLIGGANTVSNQVAASSAQLQASAEQTSSATEHISIIMQEIDSGTGSQVQNISINQQLIENVSSGMTEIIGRTEGMTETIEASNITSEKGKIDLNNATNQVKKIEVSTTRMSEVIQELDINSTRIGEIISVITKIAEQTNLLALNAAIEAARAGESGKGFAIVADEVRSLAEQSRKSADEIKSVVEIIQKETAATVNEMKTGKEEVEKGLQLINIAEKSFQELEGSLINITEENEIIRDITVKVSTDANLASEKMNFVSTIANENAAGTEAIASATEEQMASMEEVAASAIALTKQAEELQELIGKFEY